MARLDWMVQSSLPSGMLGAQEKDHRRAQGEFALDVIPDPALQRQHGLAATQRRRPQPHWELPARPLREPKSRSRKRSYTYLMHSMRTLRFLLITRAARLTRIGDRRCCHEKVGRRRVASCKNFHGRA